MTLDGGHISFKGRVTTTCTSEQSVSKIQSIVRDSVSLLTKNRFILRFCVPSTIIREVTNTHAQSHIHTHSLSLSYTHSLSHSLCLTHTHTDKPPELLTIMTFSLVTHMGKSRLTALFSLREPESARCPLHFPSPFVRMMSIQSIWTTTYHTILDTVHGRPLRLVPSTSNVTPSDGRRQKINCIRDTENPILIYYHRVVLTCTRCHDDNVADYKA